jgi:glycosyltransferase involved in cell wall biosynthesis
MRILFFYFAELGHLGGVETTVLNLAKAFSRAGHDSGIVEMAPSAKPTRLLDGAYPVWTIAAPSNPSIGRPRSWASFVRCTWQLARAIRQFKADVVHVHYPLGQALPLAGLRLLPHRWKLVVTVHGSDIRVAPVADPRVRRRQAALLRHADAITAVSQPLREDTLRLHPSVYRNFIAIPNGVSKSWFQPIAQLKEPNAKYLLFVGRLHLVKGADILLDAWRRITSRFPDLELWLAGDGAEGECLKKMVQNHGTGQTVRFLGSKSPEEIALLYRNAAAFVLPSRSEGMPLSLLEAGASGALCIGSRLAVTMTIVEDGITGFLADIESADSLASAIVRALALSHEENHRIRQALQSLVKRDYSEEKIASQYLELFASLTRDTTS